MNPNVTEQQFQDALVDVARLYGWRAFHARPAQTGKGWRTAISYDGKGFPDLTLIHPSGSVMFVECKSKKGRPSPEQEEWRTRMESMVGNVGTDRVRYYYWKPQDWDTAVEVLYSLAR